MSKTLKYFKKNRKLTLGVLSIAAFFIFAAIAIPLVSDNSSAAFILNKKATSITITLDSSKAEVGTKVHGDGLLISTIGISHAKISLKVTLPDGTVKYPLQGSRTYTADDGTFDIDYVPTQIGLYKFTAVYSGTYRLSSATGSASFNVAAPEAPTTPVKSASSIALNLASSSIEIGKTMHADGTLAAGNGITNAMLNILVTMPDGTTVNPIQGSQVTTGTNGIFAVDYTPTSAGMYKFSATYGGNELYNSSTSSVSFSAKEPAITYKGATSLSLSLATSSIEIGKTMHADGSLKGTTTIAGASIGLKVTLPDGSSANPTQGATTITDGSGNFVIDYVPTMVGTYKFTATFAGNDQYNGSSVSASFTTSNPAPQTTDAKYIITKESGIYYAKSAAGKTLTSNSDLAEVIQTALRYLTANRVTEEKVSVQCDGILSKAIVLPSYSILELGAGNTLQCSSGHSAVIGVDVDHVEVLGGHWDGTQTQCQGLIDFTRCDDVYIHDLEAFGTLTLSPNYDIRLEDCTNSLIANNELHGSKWNSNSHAGIELVNDCSDIRITGNVIYDHGWNGIILVVNNNPGTHTLWRTTIDHNTITNVAHDGISLYPIMHAAPASYIRDTIVEYNTLTDTAATSNGCYIWVQGIIENQGDVINTIVRYNTLRNTGIYTPSAMIQVAGTGSQIYNNDIYDAGGKAAIALILSYNASVHDNNIIGTRGSTDGILLMGSCNNVISNNQIKNCYLGIEMRPWVSSDSNYPSDDSSANVFSGNTINTPRSAGVYIASASGSYVQTGNQISNNHFVGLPSSYPTGIVNYGSGTVVSGNIVS